MEELEIVSETTGECLGVYVPRHEVIRRRLWCRSTNVFVLNRKGQILCHQRSMGKERLPGYWSTHLGGHVSRHETFESNALKELQEESGLQLSMDQLIPWRTTRLAAAKLWVREFVVLADVEIEDLTPQAGEVDQFSWKTFEEIKQEMTKRVTPWCAGTLDFQTEYQCLLAVLTAAHAMGLVSSSVCPALPSMG